MILLMGVACLAAAWAVLRPDTVWGRALREALIEAPARLLGGKGAIKMFVGVLVIVFVLSVIAAPELLAVVAVSDLTIYFEVMTVAMLLGAGTRLRTAAAMAILPARWVASVFQRLRTGFSARERRGGRPARRNANPPKLDPEPAWSPAFA